MQKKTCRTILKRFCWAAGRGCVSGLWLWTKPHTSRFRVAHHPIASVGQELPERPSWVVVAQSLARWRRQDDTWAAASEVRLWPEHPCLRGSHAWSSAGGLSSKLFADPHDVASSSILGIFQLLSKHVFQESEIVEGDVVPFESYCRMSHAGVSAMS